MSPESIGSLKSIEEIEFKSPKVKAAYEFAKECHEGQERKSGEPYFVHCEAVYKIIKDEWGIDNEIFQIAALLHDAPEDNKNISIKDIELKFGIEVADLVSR